MPRSSRRRSYAGPDFGLGETAKVRVNDIMSVTETAGHLIDGLDGRARAFVQVQNGCDHRCTFCIIPYGRGKSRSVPMGAVVDQIRRLVENGYAEVVLTGVDITSYGPDLPGRPTPRHAGRARSCATCRSCRGCAFPRSIRSRPTPDLMRAIAEEERLMPHLHLSLQSGDDMILKRMKRRHLRADAIRFATEARRLRPDIVFGADIIAGFPTETEAMFENSLRIVDECGLTYLHVFPYSPRPGTPAARMPQLDRAPRQGARRPSARQGRRGARPSSRGRDRRAPRTSSSRRDGRGRTEHFTESLIDGPGRRRSCRARITGRTARSLIATPLAEAA